MRKFSKILTVLLTLCLLCGVFVSIFASAEEATGPLLNVTGDSPMYNDFDGNKSTYGGERSWSNSTNGYPMNMKVFNGHLRLYRDPALAVNNTKAPAPTYHISQLSYTKNPLTTANSGNLTASDYATVDFDFGVDQWAYSYEVTNDNGTPDDTTDDTVSTVWETAGTKEEIPEAYRASAQLAYIPMSFTLGGRAIRDVDVDKFDSSLFGESNFTFFAFKQGSDGNWGVYDSKGTTLLYVLSNEINVYDHFTYLIKTTKISDATVEEGVVTDHADYTATAYLYINGEYVTNAGTIGTWSLDLAMHCTGWNLRSPCPPRAEMPAESSTASICSQKRSLSRCSSSLLPQ